MKSFITLIILTMKAILFLVFFGIAIFGSGIEKMPPVKVYTATDGNWVMPGAWIGGVVPTAGQIAVIRHDITVNSEVNILSIEFEGTTGKIGYQVGGKINTGL
jgi:hypothetical protein